MIILELNSTEISFSDFFIVFTKFSHQNYYSNILSLIDKLSSDNEDELYKCTICLYNIFKVLYKDTEISEEYKTSLTTIKDSMKVMKVKFKIMDILGE